MAPHMLLTRLCHLPVGGLAVVTLSPGDRQGLSRGLSRVGGWEGAPVWPEQRVWDVPGHATAMNPRPGHQALAKTRCWGGAGWVGAREGARTRVRPPLPEAPWSHEGTSGESPTAVPLHSQATRSAIPGLRLGRRPVCPLATSKTKTTMS